MVIQSSKDLKGSKHYGYSFKQHKAQVQKAEWREQKRNKKRKRVKKSLNKTHQQVKRQNSFKQRKKSKKMVKKVSAKKKTYSLVKTLFFKKW